MKAPSNHIIMETKNSVFPGVHSFFPFFFAIFIVDTEAVYSDVIGESYLAMTSTNGFYLTIKSNLKLATHFHYRILIY